MKSNLLIRTIFTIALAILVPLSQTQAATYTVSSNNVPASVSATNLDWFGGGANVQATWIGGDPVSTNTTEVTFYENTTTALRNTIAETITYNLNNGGVAFELGTLTLNGRGSATANAHLTNNITGDALNFSGATGTINLNSINNGRNFFFYINNNIQLGTASSASVLTITGNGTAQGSFSSPGFVINGNISELQAGGGSVIKEGTSVVALGGSNTFSGGVMMKAGALWVGSKYAIGTGTLTFAGNSTVVPYYGANPIFDNSVVISNGVTATLNVINGNYKITFAGPVSGNGTLYVNDSDSSAGGVATLSSAANLFTGTVIIGSNQTAKLVVNSLPDSANPIRFVGGANGQIFELGAGTATSLLFSNRQFELNGTTGGATINNNNASAGNTITILRDLLVTRAGNKTLTLGGTNAGVNTFAGNIADGAGAVVSLTKTDGGTWALAGTNSYTGNTSLSAVSTTGRLIFQGSQSLSPSTKLVFAQNSSNVQSVRFLDDATGTISFNRPIEFGGNNTIQALNIFVGNNNTANLGNSAGTTTGSTILVGTITFTSVASDTGTTSINVTGANDYRLQTGLITLNNLVTRTAGLTTFTKLNPTTANMTVAAITMATGNTGIANDGVPILLLDGTSPDNYVTGEISNAPDYLTGQALSLIKDNTSLWTLSGTNTYTGATTIKGGTLIITSLGNVGGGGSSLGAPTTVADGTIKIGTTTTGAALRYTGTGSTSDRVIDLAGTTGGATLDQSGSGLWKFTSNLTATGAGKKTLTLTGSTAGIGEIGGAIVDNALINTTTVVKAGSGTWVLSGTNTYRGFTVISNGTLRINGMLTAAGNGSIVTNIAGTLGGNGTIERTVVIRNGATISPGASIGTLTVSNLTLQSGALLNYELGAIANSDKIIATGTLALGGLEFSQFTWTTLGGFTAGDYTLIDAAGLSGSLGSLTNGFIGGIAAGLWLDTANNNLMLTVIPEPGSLLLVGAGLAFFLVMRRRR